ncbi:uncharacterized protein METZ01_LOCUS391018, partial [marine metagenome]
VGASKDLIKIISITACLMLLFMPVRAQVPPDESWRSIETQHFRVTFPEYLEALGRRAANRAEEAYVELSAALID